MKTETIEELFHLKNHFTRKEGFKLLKSDIQWSSASKVYGFLKCLKMSDNWHEEEAFGDYPYRTAWIDLKNRQILTYCEGDLTLSVAPDAESFYNELASSAKFYKEN